MKRNERTLYRIELLYMRQNNFSQVGQYVSKFWNCQFLQRRCSDQDLILGFQIYQSTLNLLNLIKWIIILPTVHALETAVFSVTFSPAFLRFKTNFFFAQQPKTVFQCPDPTWCEIPKPYYLSICEFLKWTTTKLLHHTFSTYISAHTLKLNIIDENNGRFCCMRYKQCTMGSNIFKSHICTPTINFLRYYSI